MITLPVVLSRNAAIAVTFASNNPTVLQGGTCTVPANSNGCAATLTAGAVTSTTPVTITASSTGANGSPQFSVNVLPAVQERLEIAGGNQQSAPTGAEFASRLQVRYVRDGVNVSGAQVRFDVAGAPGVVGTLGALGSSSALCTTGVNGTCEVVARAGAVAGRWGVEARAGSATTSFELTNTAPLTAGDLAFEEMPSARVATVGTNFFNSEGALRVRSPRGELVGVSVEGASAASVLVTPSSCMPVNQICVFTVRATQVPGSAVLRFTSPSSAPLLLEGLEVVGRAEFQSPAENEELSSSTVSVRVSRAGPGVSAFPRVTARNASSGTALLASESSCQPSSSGTCDLSLNLSSQLQPGPYNFRLELDLPGFSSSSLRVTRPVTFRVNEPTPNVRTLTITAPASSVQSLPVETPFQVEARLSEGTNGVSGQTLQFGVNPSSCARFAAGATCVTAASGACAVAFTAGPVEGCNSYVISVRAPGVGTPVERRFANVPVEGRITVTPTSPSGIPGLLAPESGLSLEVVVRTANGAVPDGTAVAIRFVSEGSPVLSAANANLRTNAEGRATFELRALRIGKQRFSFVVQGVVSSREFEIEVTNAASVGASSPSAVAALADVLTDAAAPDGSRIDRIALAAARSIGALCASSPAAAQSGSNAELWAGCTALIRAAEGQSSQSIVVDALRALSGEEARNLSDAAYSMSQDRTQLLQQRLAAVRGGGGAGFGAESLSLSSGSASLSLGQLGALASALAAVGAPESDGTNAAAGPWGSFVMGSYVRSNVGAVGATRDHDFTSYNLLAGADYRLGDSVVIGAALGQSRGDLGYGAGDVGGQDAESSSLSFYGARTLASGGVFEAALSLARHRFDYVREVNLRAIQLGRFVNIARVDADELSLLINFSYPMTLLGTRLVPEFGMVGSATSIDAFTERDLAAGSSNIWRLSVPDHDYSSLQSRISVRAERSFTLESDSVVSVHGSLQGYYELLDGRGIVTPTFAAFSNAPAPSFQLNERSTSYGVLDFGLSWRSRRGFGWHMTGGTYLGLEKTDRFYVNLGASYMF